MIGNIFLGKFWHWVLIFAAAGLLWFCGAKRLHVIEFNLFVISMIVGTALAVLAVVRFHKTGEQVTRDPLVAHDDGGEDSSAPTQDRANLG